MPPSPIETVVLGEKTKVAKGPVKTRQKVRQGMILVSFFLFPATFFYLSPVLIVEAAAQGVVNGSFILFAAMFVSALVLGRAYCGWLCPGAGCQEALFAARDRAVTRGGFIKWLVWTPWIGTIAFLAFQGGGYRRVDFWYRTTHGVSIATVGDLVAYGIVLFALIVLPALLVGKRSFCHHLCWMAPFMILGRKLRNRVGWRALGLRADGSRCKHCHTCARHCPMSLPVENMVARQTMEHVECILCGTCADGCCQGAIRYTFGRGVD